jgi:hypothetical protein
MFSTLVPMNTQISKTKSTLISISAIAFVLAIPAGLYALNYYKTPILHKLYSINSESHTALSGSYYEPYTYELDWYDSYYMTDYQAPVAGQQGSGGCDCPYCCGI